MDESSGSGPQCNRESERENPGLSLRQLLFLKIMGHRLKGKFLLLVLGARLVPPYQLPSYANFIHITSTYTIHPPEQARGEEVLHPSEMQIALRSLI